MRRRRLQVAALALAATVTAIVWLNSRGRVADGPQSSLLLVTIDTLRADHVGCYGYGRDTTPHLDALAAEGIRFDQATTPRGKTQPSMVSMLTGLYPHEHGIRINIGQLPPVQLALDPEDPLRPSTSTPVLLAEELSAAGLATGGFVGNFVLTAERTGLDRGFDTYDDEMTSTEFGRDDAPERKASENTDRAIRWMKGHADEAFFLWVHYIDPHGTYEPPAAFDRFKSEPMGRVPLGAMRKAVAVDDDGWRIFVPPHNIVLNPATGKRQLELARYIDLYDGEIAYTDAEIGRLLATLDELERADDTLVIVTADHGESLGEHQLYFEHGYYTYDVSVRLPLIVRLPASDERFAGPGAGRVVREPVDLLDLRPTILDWLGLTRTASPSGRSLLDVLQGDTGDPDRVTFTERSEFGSLMRAARTPEWKLIYNLATPEDWPLPYARELYDLTADPYEASNLYGSGEARAAAAQARLEEELDAWMRNAGDLRSFVGEDLEAIANMPQAHLDAMQAIGYVDSERAAQASGAHAAEEFRESPPPETDDPREVLQWALAGGPELRSTALTALARYDALPVETLLAYLEPTHDVLVRARAAELAGELGHADAVPTLQRVRAHADPAAVGLQLACTYALTLLDDTGADDALLVDALTHASSGVRGLAAWYLGRLGRTDALEPLTRDPSGVVQSFAWHSLAADDASRAVTELERLAQDARPLTVQAATLALVQLRAPDENRALVQTLRQSSHPWIVNVGTELAVWTSPGEAVRALRERDRLAPVERRRLMNAAATVAGSLALDELRDALGDADPDVRVIAASHLLRLEQESGGR